MSNFDLRRKRRRRRIEFPSLLQGKQMSSWKNLLGCFLVFGTICYSQAFSQQRSVLLLLHYRAFHYNNNNNNNNLAISKPTTTTQSVMMTKSDSSSSSSSSTPEIPANLRRKVSAKRPLLGHIVPSSSNIQKRGGRQAPKLRPQGQLTTNERTKTTSTTNPSRIRVAGGIARGRKLDAPNVYLRPMMGKVKEAVYSTLTYFGVYDDTTAFVRHVDIFAGSGSVGIESLSRGANGCIFVDLSDDCCQCIQHNLERTGLVTTNNNNKDAIQIVRADAMEFFKFPQKFGIQTTCQILTICPPYEEVAYGDVMEAAVSSPVVAESDTILIVEYPVELGTLPHVITASRRNFNENENNNTNYLDHHGFETNTAVGIRNRRYGRTVIAMYVINPSGKLVRADSRPEEFVAPV